MYYLYAYSSRNENSWPLLEGELLFFKFTVLRPLFKGEGLKAHFWDYIGATQIPFT